MSGDFGYEDGEMVYPVQDWLVKNTFLDIPEPPSVSLGSFFKDREVRSCPPRTVHLGGLMTAILESVSDGEECCPNDVLEAASDDGNSGLDLRGCESPFPSQLVVCAEHQVVGSDSHASPGVCNTEWVWLPTLAQQVQPMSQGSVYSKPAENCCVVFMEETLLKASNETQLPVLCLSEALQAPSLTNLPSAGSAGHHFGQCQPCAFTAKGCAAGESCDFCHLCDPSEHKRQKKQKRVLRRAAEWAQQVVQTVGREQELESGAVAAREFNRQAAQERGRRTRG